MRKTLLFGLIIIMVLIGGYLYLRYSVLKSKDFTPDISKSESPLDLRPALIAKLQQLVKDGSNGLYNLRVTQVEPSITNSEIDFTGVVLTPDTLALAQLDGQQMAPDDVFKISFKKLHISGIGIGDMLNKKDLNLNSILLENPVVEVFNKERSYNAGKRLQNDTLTLYQKIAKHFKTISIDNISVKNGTIVSHVSKTNETNRYNNVSIKLDNIQIDSSTQYDQSRFLFAKNANLSLGKYSVPTADGLYFLGCSSIIVSADNQTLTATNVELTPRFTKQAFQKQISRRKDRYDIKIPKLVLSGVDWWKLANKEKLFARQADIYNGSLSDYVDMSKPQKPLELNNYPHQAIMKIKMPVSIDKIKMHNMSVVYEELSDASSKTGTVYFDKISGELRNFTNVPAMAKGKNLTFNAKAIFMKKVPMNVAFNFNLAKYKTGNFSADISAGAISYALLNQLAEPLGLFSLKSGEVQKATAHMVGDNFKVNSDFLMLYNDLYIIPMKKDDEAKNGLKKKKIIGAIANLLIIKNSNPDKSGEIRNLKYVVPREQYPNFFSHLWKTMLRGIITTIGAPAKLA
jgi:hypothetical protein